MMEQKKFKYIKKPSWFGDEGPLYEAPEIKEVLRVLFDQQMTGVKQMSIWENSLSPGLGTPPSHPSGAH